MANEKKGNLLQMVLVVLLVGAAFAMGSMLTELKVLKGEKKQVIKQETQVPEKEEATELTDEQWQEVVDGAVAYKGDGKAQVTVVEFTDYQCPFCKSYFDQTMEQIETDYIDTGKVRYILRDLPLAFHQNAQITAEAARCAEDQNMYWEYHDKLFETQADWSEATDNSLFKDYAGELGLDQVEFVSCLEEGKYTQVVKDDLALAQKLGVNGTPTFFINGKKLVGAQPFESFKSAFEAELK